MMDHHIELFDDDGDDKEADTTIDYSCRPAENGILQFHKGTEDALLLHVRGNKANVIVAMDEFCVQRHWMMHCGPEKGTILENFLLERYQQQPNSDFTIVELGSYCGYSAIRMAQCIPSAMIYSIDVDPKLLRIAREMADLAQVRIQFLLRTEDTTLDGLLQTFITQHRIDVLVLDHAKECYLPDLRHLEDTDWLQPHSAVWADNVTFADIEDYVDYMRSNPRLERTETKSCYLEYSDDQIPDGIGRSSVY